MSCKRNRTASSEQKPPHVKSEPVDYHHVSRVDSFLLTQHAVTPELVDARVSLTTELNPTVQPHFGTTFAPIASQPPVHSSRAFPKRKTSVQLSDALYTTHASVQDIEYTPEKAFDEGLGMVEFIKKSMRKLELGSKMRKDVWLREVAQLESQGAPTTLIAVCGATGAGKSSLLNAILDDNIVPTSGMRACTAVVTEIAYHNKPTIEGDVSFLSLEEWKEELEVLLQDLTDEDGNLRRVTSLRGEAGVAWHKVHAVYPSIAQEQLAMMTADQIIACDPTVSACLSTTKHICTKDSEAFAKEISKFIDSKNQKCERKNDQDEKDTDDKLMTKKSKKTKKFKKNQEDHDGPALWPLIRQVVVKCKSAALSTGATLVDLPGVADANAARSNICKDYMKKCDRIWVLAPITRAVDDRTAKDLLGDAFKIQLKMDGNYDGSAITFIATKADDVSCSEVIRSLPLEDDEDIEAVEEKIEEIIAEQKKWKTSKTAADRAVNATLRQVRALDAEYREHLMALKNDESSSSRSHMRKRKHTGQEKESVKRRKGESDGEGSDAVADDTDLDDVVDDDDDIDDFLDDDVEDASKIRDSGSASSGSSSSDKDSVRSDSDDEQEVADSMDVENEAPDLKARIKETIKKIETLRMRLNSERAERKKAADEIINANDRLAKVQIEKNGICSLKRSEFSREVLKEDFRMGLKEIDEAEAQERNPDAFNPSQQIRNYENIDLPTFCASARDYIRIKKQVKGDGEPTCFTKPEDTDIPALQEWCQTLTISSRQRAARDFLTHLGTFIASARSYLRGIAEVREEDRKALSEQWQSVLEQKPKYDSDESDNNDELAYDSDQWFYPFEGGVFHATRKKPEAKVDSSGALTGVTQRLINEFALVIDNAVDKLENSFRNGLNDKLNAGASQAAASALDTSDRFAASMHWATYRATLRRHGSFARCLNTELIVPLTKNIASSWAKVFEADMSALFEAQTMQVINTLLEDVENSAAAGLKDRAKQQGEVALEEAKVAMESLVRIVQDNLNSQQKEVSRCLVPHVREQMRSGYDRAMEERGRGSVARQKAVFHDYVCNTRDDVFNDGAETVLQRLGAVAGSIGDAMRTALEDLAQKIEVSMSVLWETPRDDPSQVRVRREAISVLKALERQVALWMDAERIDAAQKTDAQNSI